MPKKGAFVRTVSHDDIRELYQIREALEVLAIRLGAPRLDRSEFAGFEARFRELKARGPRLAYTDVRPIGEEFHRYLIKQSGNARLMAMLEQIQDQIRSVWTMYILAPRRVQGLVHEHLALIDALKRGAVKPAERLMAAHVRRVRDTIFRLLD